MSGPLCPPSAGEARAAPLLRAPRAAPRQDGRGGRRCERPTGSRGFALTRRQPFGRTRPSLAPRALVHASAAADRAARARPPEVLGWPSPRRAAHAGVAAALLARGRRARRRRSGAGGATARRQRAIGRPGPAWGAEEVAGWEDLGLFQDSSDPRRGTVALKLEPGTGRVRMLHSEYGPVPLEGRHELQGASLSAVVDFGALVAAARWSEEGLQFDDGRFAARVVGSVVHASASETATPASAQMGSGDARAYSNAVSVLEQPCFSEEQCKAVILSRKLLKGKLGHTGVTFDTTSAEDWRVPEDWRGISRRRDLKVRSWQQHLGSWGAFDEKAAYESWRDDEPAGQVPSVSALRAHGYFLKFFPGFAGTGMQRRRLLQHLQVPASALAQHLVQYATFWAQNPSRIDEVEAIFAGMTRERFEAQTRNHPERLLAQMARERALGRVEQLDGTVYQHLRGVDPVVQRWGDLALEILRSDREIGGAAEVLRNCAACYRRQAATGECVLIVLRRGEKLVAMGEWRPGYVQTSSGEKRWEWAQIVETGNAAVRSEWRSMFQLVLRDLVDLGADLNARDTEGQTALLLAAEHCKVDVIRVLAELGADLEARDREGRTALHRTGRLFAAGCGRVQVIRALAEVGADLEGENQYGQTALLQAAAYGSVEHVRVLAELGADLEAKGRDGRTALVVAMAHGDEETVSVLAELGADLEVKDRSGRWFVSLPSWVLTSRRKIMTAELSFKGRFFTELVMLFLLQVGADFEARDRLESAALMGPAQTARE
ncbi:unnamed protein product [Prorocentrum cordatum]|uniref:Uncharacterized protein n=1 Tax=Prorocentrum cordatum TaxID=2364126 RepID=A0ABN9TR00_9DINO|nr:unnamed protein product [Polarella glacialis]